MLANRTSIRIVTVVICLGACVSLMATSVKFSKFSKPILQADRLICTAPDSKRVICVRLDGTKLWEKSFDETVSLFSGRKSEPLLQIKQVVNSLSATGELFPQFTVQDANDKVSYHEDSRLFVSHDRRFKERTFKVIDDKTGKALWTSRDVESLVCATPELLIALTTERIPSERGYTFGKGALQAFDRINFTEKWRVEIADKGVLPYLDATLNGPNLVYADGPSSLSIINVASGRKVATKVMDLPKYGRIIDVQSFGDQIVWLTHEMRSHDFNQTEHTLHFCSVPELLEKKVVTVRLIEIARIAFEGDFIISDALYRTACFRMTGEKVWERFQSNRTKTMDGRIYFSDYHQAAARVGYVEVSTGNEKILYSEPTK